jgi:death on curing protein
VRQTWQWVSEATILAIHDEQLAEHGGRPGIRDRGLLQAALARPKHKAAYGKPDVAQLGAAYAFAIVKGHPFVDGKKRTAFVALELFLLINGYGLVASETEILAAMLGLAIGEISEMRLARWVRTHLRRYRRAL